MSEKKKRGLASVDKATRERVAQSGGNALHKKRGLQSADKETRKRVSNAGVKARYG